MSNSLFLQDIIPCPYCSKHIELDPGERLSGSFECPYCQKRIDDLIAFWRTSPADWNRVMGFRTFKKIGWCAVTIVLTFVAFEFGILEEGNIKLVARLAFVWASIILIRSLLDYLRHAGRKGVIYLYADHLDSTFGKASWNDAKSARRSWYNKKPSSVTFLEDGAFVFEPSGGARTIVVPIPEGEDESGMEVYRRLQQVLQVV